MQWCRYQSEVQRLRHVFRTAVAGDVARLKDAVAGYKENTDRLECQKQLLLKQVCLWGTLGLPQCTCLFSLSQLAECYDAYLVIDHAGVLCVPSNTGLRCVEHVNTSTSQR